MMWLFHYLERLAREMYTGPLVINFHKGNPSRKVKRVYENGKEKK